MHLRIDFLNFRFYIALTHSVLVDGVNSKVGEGNHFLMWDFDDKSEEEVKAALVDVQKRYKLPRIFLINTGLPFYWHAYCFKGMSFADCVHILASTKHIDKVFLKIGFLREYYTLRFSPKKGRDFKEAIILPSRYREDVNPYRIDNFLKYWTKRL